LHIFHNTLDFFEHINEERQVATGQSVGYVRVSSVDQNLARQLDGIKLDRVFEDKASGKDTKRPALAALQVFVR
jgi:predicted site-specific integrase-resolvase